METRKLLQWVAIGRKNPHKSLIFKINNPSANSLDKTQFSSKIDQKDSRGYQSLSQDPYLHRDHGNGGFNNGIAIHKV